MHTRNQVLRDERRQLPQNGTLVPLLPHLRLEAGLGRRSERVFLVEDVTSALICADVEEHVSCALRKLDRVELLVPIEVSRLYAKKLREFKVELKLEKLCDADGGVVCTHGEVGCGEGGRWLGAREKWFHFPKRLYSGL